MFKEDLSERIRLQKVMIRCLEENVHHEQKIVEEKLIEMKKQIEKLEQEVEKNGKPKDNLP